MGQVRPMWPHRKKWPLRGGSQAGIGWRLPAGQAQGRPPPDAGPMLARCWRSLLGGVVGLSAGAHLAQLGKDASLLLGSGLLALLLLRLRHDDFNVGLRSEARNRLRGGQQRAGPLRRPTLVLAFPLQPPRRLLDLVVEVNL